MWNTESKHAVPEHEPFAARPTLFGWKGEEEKERKRQREIIGAGGVEDARVTGRKENLSTYIHTELGGAYSGPGGSQILCLAARLCRR